MIHFSSPRLGQAQVGGEQVARPAQDQVAYGAGRANRTGPDVAIGPMRLRPAGRPALAAVRSLRERGFEGAIPSEEVVSWASTSTSW
jgi:hypothetical protein